MFARSSAFATPAALTSRAALLSSPLSLRPRITLPRAPCPALRLPPRAKIAEDAAAQGAEIAQSVPGGSGGDGDAGGDGAGKAGRAAMAAVVILLGVGLVEHDWISAHRDAALIGLFFAGYGSIVLEGLVDVNKAGPALLMSAGIWTTMLVSAGVGSAGGDAVLGGLGEAVLEVGQILLFLAGAMSAVEIMDGHDAFRVVTDKLPRGSRRQLLWAVGLATFFLSCVLDDLTTTIVMLSLLRKIIPADDAEVRAKFGGLVVIAANAGGAWSPIGDVTTTLIWQHGNISVFPTILSLFVPSLVCMLAATALIAPQLEDGPVASGEAARSADAALAKSKPPGSEPVFWTGLGALLFVPIFKTSFGVPPYLAMSVALGGLWAFTDFLHAGKEGREELRGEHLIQRVDINSLVFFMGILLAMGGLQEAGILASLSQSLDATFPNRDVVAGLIGFSSAIVDNVALVAATLGMWSLDQVPIDNATWQEIAFAAGTGGSMLCRL